MSEDKNLKDAQYRKSLSISYFNSLNAAIELMKASGLKGEELKKGIQKWRDFFIAEHSEYYAKAIENVGVAYRAEESIKGLKKAKTMAELEKKWLELSADERRDGEIIKAVGDLKALLLKKAPKVEPKPIVEKPKPDEKTRQHKAGVTRVAPNKKG